MTIEDKEKNLVELNQQIILRTQESQNSRQNNNYERLIIEELLPQNNIKITQKLVQKKQQDDSLCQIDNSYISGNQTNNVVASQQSPLVKAQVDSPQILKAPLV